jgi:hypothetical protein
MVFTFLRKDHPMDIAAFLSAITNFSNALRLIEELIHRNTGTKRKLLLEMEENLSTIELYSVSGAPIDKVINSLKTERLKEVMDSNFDFNNIKKSKVTANETDGVPFYAPYIGFSTEDLFKKVYLKISELQRVVEIDTDNPNIRKSVRLINIFKLIKLILVHINS